MKSTPSRSSGTVARTGLFVIAFAGFVTVSGAALASEWDGWNNEGIVGTPPSNEILNDSSNAANAAWGNPIVGDQGTALQDRDSAGNVEKTVVEETMSPTWGYSSPALDAATMEGCSSPADCDDGNACTGDVCMRGACINPFNTNPCDDGDSCTSGDQCQLGACVSGEHSCMGQVPTRPSLPTPKPQLPNRCDEGSRMCSFGQAGTMCVPNENCCSSSDCSGGQYCTFFLTCQCAPGEHMCGSTGQCSAGDCCPGDSCDDGNSCTEDACVRQPNGTSTPYYLCKNPPIPLCGGCSANVGQVCTSQPNQCGQTTSGTIQCDGSCSVAVPPPITGTHLSCALGQCIIFPNIPGQCEDVAGCKGLQPGGRC